MLEGKKTSFALTVIASSLLVGCNGSDSDSKVVSKPEVPVAASGISGVALDGYLKNAKVCLDLNHNLTCDSGDGEAVWTDSEGKYSLAQTDADLSQANVLVEAIANKTVDLDFPQSPVEHGFALTTPATLPAVVSPLTTLTTIVAKQQGIDFKAARDLLAADLGIDSQRLTSDFLAGSHAQDKELHALAQGLTALMQQAEDNATADGVTLGDARTGSRIKLALLDLPALKVETDKLVGTVNNTPVHVQEAVKDFISSVTVSREEVAGNSVQVQPQAPKQATLNEAARTFDWSWVGMLTSVAQYEYSVDAGKTWQQAKTKPLHLGKDAYAAGEIQVRVLADIAKNMAAGKVAKNAQPLAETQVPAAPASLTINDVKDEFDWDLVDGYADVNSYEYSIDGGKTWQAATQKPVPVGDVAIAAGDVKVRIAANDSGVEPTEAGREVVSTAPFTVVPEQPVKPTNLVANDDANSVEWDYVAGFTEFNLYEVSLDNGKTWKAVTAKPLSVGNVNIDAGWVQLRVAANSANGMPAGDIAKVAQAFTVQAGKPGAPTNLRVDDAANSIDWDIVDGFDDAASYEISLKGNSGNLADWNPAGTKPAVVGDMNIAKGEVCLRVKADVKNGNVAGIAACSDAYFTVKPEAPTAPVINDDKDTFGWTLVEGYSDLTGYEIKIEAADWKVVGQYNNPYQLANKDYAVGSIQVRVAADAVTGRAASDALSNDLPYTQTVMASDNTLLTAAGVVTQNRAEAACVKTKNGKVWQLFNETDAAKRFMKGEDIYAELEAFSACGLTTWRMPTTDELQSLFTDNPNEPKEKVFDESIFAYMNVSASYGNNEKACYLSATGSTSTPTNKDCFDISLITKPRVTDIQDVCTGFCFYRTKPLYRFIAE